MNDEYNGQEELLYEVVKWIEKWPSWIRWIIAIPLALILETIVSFVVRYAVNWGWQDKFIVDIIMQLLNSTVFVYFFVSLIYIIIPKYKLRSTLIISSIIILVYLFCICYLGIRYSNGSMQTSDAIIFLLEFVAIIVVTIISNIYLFKKNYDVERRSDFNV